ncbi:MAG TPA: type II secretion system F family protein [Polyangiaceae bacterium]|nr:type II secretion system F family protein [Polyangiaceae bacterium]
MAMLLAFKFGTVLLAALAAAGIVVLISWVPLPARPRLGYRGQERNQAIKAGDVFAALEPLIRFVAGIVSLVPLASFRKRQEQELRRADYCLGLTPDEYSALSLLSATALGGIAFAVARTQGYSSLIALPAFALGLMLPTLQVREIIRQRVKEISRGLPHAIEICALCMGAGLDFPGALRLVAGPKSRGALAREFSGILEEIELGHTRRDALVSFAERVQTDAVRDFVAAVVQAEQKGNPLARVIQIQGRMLSQRRSVAAEEAAARAGVLMIGPMMLLVLCVLLLLMGPFLTKGINF